MAEQSKVEKKKFVLKKEAIKNLTNSELERVGGGMLSEPGMGVPPPYFGGFGNR